MQYLKKIIDKFFKIDFWNVFIVEDSFQNFISSKGKNLKKQKNKIRKEYFFC